MKIKLLTIVGARPQIIKSAALNRAIRDRFSDRIEEVVLNTGQHYDENMADVFIKELDLPKPTYNLNIGSGSHAFQTAGMLTGIEEVIDKECPNAIVLYGDTNSTLAGALAASKKNVPVIHIEAGLRSFNKSMPEEINRIVCDHISTFLYSPTETGVKNLVAEGFKTDNDGPFSADNPKVYHCGDIMFDNSKYFSAVSAKHEKIFTDLGLEKDQFVLATIHRPDNTDSPNKLTSIFKALIKISEQSPIVLPLHPRTANNLADLPIAIRGEVDKAGIHLIDPVSYLEMISLEKSASMIITDSGGVQKEAYFFEKPCMILRNETEWVEIVNAGCCELVGSETKNILEGFDRMLSKQMSFPPIFGDGKSAAFICETIIKNFT